jgi:hypothetical protein
MNLTRDNDVVNALTQITVGSGAAKRALPLRALNIDVDPLTIACTGRKRIDACLVDSHLIGDSKLLPNPFALAS